MFSVNSLNSVTKIYHSVKGFEPLSPSHLLCERPACYYSASTTHVRDRIFKLNPIHASMNINFLNSLNSVKFTLHLGKTPLSWKTRFITRRHNLGEKDQGVNFSGDCSPTRKCNPRMEFFL